MCHKEFYEVNLCPVVNKNLISSQWDSLYLVRIVKHTDKETFNEDSITWHFWWIYIIILSYLWLLIEWLLSSYHSNSLSICIHLWSELFYQNFKTSYFNIRHIICHIYHICPFIFNSALLVFTNCVMALYGGIYSGMFPDMVQYQKRKKYSTQKRPCPT